MGFEDVILVLFGILLVVVVLGSVGAARRSTTDAPAPGSNYNKAPERVVPPAKVPPLPKVEREEEVM